MPFKKVPFETAQLIEMQIQEDDGVFVATSDDLHGLIVTAHNLNALNGGIPKAMEQHFAVMGQTPPVKVIRVAGPRAEASLWVAIPEPVLVALSQPHHGSHADGDRHE